MQDKLFNLALELEQSGKYYDAAVILECAVAEDLRYAESVVTVLDEYTLHMVHQIGHEADIIETCCAQSWFYASVEFYSPKVVSIKRTIRLRKSKELIAA